MKNKKIGNILKTAKKNNRAHSGRTSRKIKYRNKLK
jgi:hypothetical protein